MSWVTEKNIERYRKILLTAEAGPRKDMVVRLLQGEMDKEKRERQRSGSVPE